MKKILFSVLLAASVFVGCNKDNDNQQKSSAENLDANKDWVFFSFSKGELVTVNDPRYDQWDIAFKEYSVRVKEGAIRTEEKDFQKVTQAPSEGYVEDVYTNIFVGRGVSKDWSSPVIYTGFDENFWNFMELRLFPTLKLTDEEKATMKTNFVNDKGWQTFAYATKKFSNNDWVYVVKTSDKKFAKIQFTSYTNKINENGYISFKYQLSNDGKF